MSSPAVVTYGPIFIGVIFNVLLYGIMITQTFLYFNTYRRDKTWMKFFVFTLFLCDTVNCAFDIAFLYIPLVSRYGDTTALEFATWIFDTDPAMTALIAMLTQLFFAWRVRVLTNNWPLVIVITTCSIVQFFGGLGTSIACGIVTEFVKFQKFEVIVILWLAFSAVADTVITFALVWYLRKHKTGFSNTDDVVNKIIRLTVQTGMITAVCAIIDLILFLATPSGLHLIFNLPLSKLYTNSLMSSLNSRQGWKYSTRDARSTTGQESRYAAGVGPATTGAVVFGTHTKTGQEVYIDVETFEMRDRDVDQKTHQGPSGIYPSVDDVSASA